MLTGSQNDDMRSISHDSPVTLLLFTQLLIHFLQLITFLLLPYTFVLTISAMNAWLAVIWRGTEINESHRVLNAAAR